MPDLKFLSKVSRPRFWIYLFGPFLVGLVSAAESTDDLSGIFVILFGIYFLWPANLLVYGINDIFDYETDRLNEKKIGYETLVGPERRWPLLFAIIVLNLPFVVAGVLVSVTALMTMFAFLLLSVFYSAPPVRAKGIPIVDSAFNVLYILPGIFAYQMLAGSPPMLVLVLAASFWTIAMHAYSAIPDIDADQKAGLNTIATLLGSPGTHIFCLLAYLASALLLMTEAPALGVGIGFVYTTLMLVSLAFGSGGGRGVFRVYRLFPLVNTMTGFTLFWYVALTRFVYKDSSGAALLIP